MSLYKPMPWDWLRAGRGAADPIEDVMTIADHIESMPETAAVFNPRELDIVHTGKLPKLLTLNNSWMLPDHLVGGGAHVKAVNPNYRYVEQYADGVVKCECGAVIAMENEWYENEYGKCQMEDVCDSRYVAHARSDMWDKRYDIIVTSAELLRSPDYVSTRLGVENGTLSYISKRMHISREDIREESRLELIELIRELKPRYTAPELARVFNRHQSTIRRWWSE